MLMFIFVCVCVSGLILDTFVRLFHTLSSVVDVVKLIGPKLIQPGHKNVKCMLS